MRIVAGSARGRRLIVPEGDRTRPTSDRVREATFNALYSLGLIDGVAYCDLFAGSGALGLEALSRGAASVTFVENDRGALRALRANIEALGFADRSAVVTGDALAWLAAERTDFDVVLADPPYGFDDWPALFAALAPGAIGGSTDNSVGNAGGMVVVAESDRCIEAGPGWRCLRQRRYGTTVVTMIEGDRRRDQENL